MIFPTLFHKTSTGKIQQWDIRVDPGSIPSQFIICTEYGEVGGKIQTTFDLVTEGKNIGKSNETTVHQQALNDAKSKWESKLKDGYVQSLEDAQQGKVDSIIEGGAEPMLAQSYDKHASKIKFPCFVQPKLDGIRCLAVKKNGQFTLWSRSRKRITSCPHIEKALDEMLPLAEDGCVLDGELYNHELKNDFEKIISAVRKDDPSEESLKVEYHIYDTVLDSDFSMRNFVLSHAIPFPSPPCIVRVFTFDVPSEETLLSYFKTFKSEGYEGAMARNSQGGYESKRSYNLQKVKEFDDADFPVIGVVEGKGKLRGNVGAFVCQMPDGTTFEAKPKGSQEESKKYLVDHTLWQGKKLVVQFQGYTGKNKVPRFPVGVRIKDSLEGS